jgi:farnesyl diphosphate synthase
MAFSQRLADTAALVETRLAELCDRLAASGTPPRLLAAMRHATLGGGKRMRPFLLIECAGLFGLQPVAALNAAAALECVHCYSLVHDDLPAMDNDELRRGRPTVHKAFDEWTAILAGDALLTLAFEVLARADTHPDAAIRAELALGLARASGAAGMVGGQCLDLEADKLGQPSRPTLADVRRLQAMKTGALIRYACEAGALLGVSNGRAFQIADDLLDVSGEAATVGKATGKDAGKATLVSLMGVEAAKAELVQLEAEAFAALQPFGACAEVLREAAAFVVRRNA